MLERDYGSGDPSKHLRPAETVLDLGSGSGKICFIACQVVGPRGRVVGGDVNDEMLALARRSAPEVARRVGHGNVSFVKGRIQDLSLDLEALDRHLRAHPVLAGDDLARLDAEMARLRRERPLVTDGSVDVVVSNCVLNLVRPEDKRRLFAEVFRVLRAGGRAVISDIVSDEDVPLHLQCDPELWSGCISGALREDLFLQAFEEAGFHGIAIAERGGEPWRTVEGIEFPERHGRRPQGKGGALPRPEARRAVPRALPPGRGRRRPLVPQGRPHGRLREDLPAPHPGAVSRAFRAHPAARARAPRGGPPVLLWRGRAAAGRPRDQGRRLPGDDRGGPRLLRNGQRQERVLLMRPALRLHDTAQGGAFDDALRERGLPPLVRGRVATLQLNVGKLCNMACHHCHVEAGPKRTERMSRETAERALGLLARSSSVEVLDLTGGAPEMNPSFRFLVEEAGRLGRRVIDRCNLTILFEPGMEDLREFLAEHGVDVVASLPCYRSENVERQRGRGVFDRSIEALRRLNALGYGRSSGALRLDLVYNPPDAFLPPPQARLEARCREELGRRFGVGFDRLLTVTNMPVKRFADHLQRTGQHQAYMGLLVNHFNPATVPDLMCRSLLSVGWDGRLYDCDFNQMLDLELGAAAGSAARTIRDLESLDGLEGQRIATGAHCFGCTAGAGSSCSGALR